MCTTIYTAIFAIIALITVDTAVAKMKVSSAEMSDYVLLQQAYDLRNWEQALKLADYFLSDFPSSTKRSSAIFIAAQSSLNLRHLNRALLESKRLLISFPKSDYSDQAHWILAQTWLMSEQYDSAKTELNGILSSAGNAEIVGLAQERLNELESYLQYQAEFAKREGNVDGTLTVALILPLTGGDKIEAAEDFLTGFRVTSEKLGMEAPLIYDNHSDPINSVLIFRNEVTKHNVWAVVGGIDQQDAAALAAAAEREQIPFLSTSCGVSGLGDIGNYAFQGRVDFTRIGAYLADHAYKQDSTLQRFGILVPMNQEGQQLAAGFRRVVTENGGEIPVEDYYYPGTDDFASYFQRFRKVGIKEMFVDSLKHQLQVFGRLDYMGKLFLETAEMYIDSLLTDSLIDSLWIAEHNRLQREIEETEIEIDSLEIPVGVYDGFLLVVEEGEGKIEALASQFARFNIQTQVMGNESWMDSESLYRVRNYVDGIVFAQPLLESDGVEYNAFRGAVFGGGDGKLNRYHLAGDRAARIISFAAQNSHGAEDVARGISQISDLKTLSGRVSFVQTEGAAISVNLIRFSGGMFENVSAIPDTIRTTPPTMNRPRFSR